MAHTQSPPPPTSSGSSSSKNPNHDNSKKTPPAPTTGDQAQVAALSSGKPPPTTWSCTIQLYSNGKPYYTENLKYGASSKFRGSLASSVDNKISAVYWKGNRCYCWVVVYQYAYYNGLNLGLWTNSGSGNYQLNVYNTWDWSAGQWKFWDQMISSYAIYCY